MTKRVTRLFIQLVLFVGSFILMFWLISPLMDYLFANSSRGVTFSVNILLLPLLIVASFLLTTFIYEKIEDVFSP
ncbi:hypothetical protein ACE1TH_15460 [Shouchella sp. JSM 1781072]|uniref:hypothetical protein n=1 Tax=Bacillaceae TaxID=186817 RepID=UPI0020D0983A|nr:hypothetical protein [Alkalihalobacillus sp. LMS6]UTR05998.1 hypothetical protein MM326_18260 [Alkalihalobacillus sp. LMS6]